ncbi:MAG TPA: glycoside hydrolase family 43 protein [Clostridia bacterium]|nr:glycoside hydrolase family 43 protein [Clostridia bacterium]
MQAYLFVHFKEKTTPDGEQVYFGVSKDGFHWEEVNGGQPVLWAYYGDKGVRDFTITRCQKNGKFVIVATDLSLSYGMRNQYNNSWEEISRKGSKCFSVWESNNLVDWTEQRLAKIGDDDFGCMWAPDIIYDKSNDDYVIHWSSSHKSNKYGLKGIYYSRTTDFQHFTEPQLLYRKEDSGVIDSAIYEENGIYYMFVKSEENPANIILLKADNVVGPYTQVEAFNKSMEELENGLYEAPTAVQLEDGKWCLFLDYYGVPGAGQGYVPFIADSLKEGRFVRSDKAFEFPYGFKHGTILTITMEEYHRIKNHDWSDKGYIV